jgi:hypothetical protein
MDGWMDGWKKYGDQILKQGGCNNIIIIYHVEERLIKV